MKKIILFIVIFMLAMSHVCFAEVIHFDLVRTEVDPQKPMYDLEIGGIGNRPPDNYKWPESIPVPVVDEFPEPNIIETGNRYNTPEYGYITYIDGEYYWTGRSGVKTASLNRGVEYTVSPFDVPLGSSIPEYLPDIDDTWRPDLYPYNLNDKKIVHEDSAFDIKGNLISNPGKIGKWIFGWDKDNKKSKIFVSGVYGIETDIPFRVYGHEVHITSERGVLYWEDEDTFYIKNYNLLLSTPKQPLYDALDALEELPVIKVNDTILGFETPPVVEADRTLVPMRFLFEQLGADVEWDEASESATAINEKNSVTFAIDNKTAKVNGKAAVMDVPARLINDKTMVPLRFLSEELGYTVEWDEDTRVATVITE